MHEILISPPTMTCFENTNPTVPKMASVFINELLARQTDSGWKSPGLIQSTRRSRIVRVLFDAHQTAQKPEYTEGNERSGQCIHFDKQASRRKSSPSDSVRILAKEISHRFNNLLMGIWGNLSLMQMNMDQQHPSNHWLNEMETLIQDGAYLTNMIIGYLSERRVFAQRVLLRQLSSEIHTLLEKKKPLGELISRLEWAKLPQCENMVTSLTGMIFQQFLEGIQTVCRNLYITPCPSASFSRQLGCVNELIDRGLKLTFQMLCSAGDIRNQKRRWINLPLMIKQLVDDAVGNYPDISMNKSISETIPLILADRKQLMMAVGLIIDNACRNAPVDEGRVEINLNMLHEESPHERCGVHTIGICLVLTVRDNGKGIPAKAQPHIFEPFYTYPESMSAVGMGLATAKGIVRSHSGYIKVKSSEHSGSTFKIYLPVRRYAPSFGNNRTAI